MSNFDTDETSIQDSRPREGIAIVIAGSVWRIATQDLDVTIGGFSYKANPAMRGEIPITSSGGADAVVVSLPIKHPAVQRYLANGVPPQQAISVTIWRQQETSGQARVEFSGYWTEMTADRHVAKITVATRAGIAFRRLLPTITVGRECAHVLYDSGCTVSRASFTYSTTVASFNGAHVVLAGIPGYGLKYGELLHVSSGERVTIGTQVGTALDVQVAIPEMNDGDAVQVFAGCAHTIDACQTFSNVVNYAGCPHLPTVNAFVPSLLGVLSQK